jgi:outer membrane protein TolC
MKRILKKGGCLLTLSMLFSASLFAQTGDSLRSATDNDANVLAFSLDEAKKYAIEHNRTIQNASYDVKKAEAAKWKAIASMLLQVSGEADYMNMLGYKMNMMGGEIPMPPYIDLGLTASFTVSGSQIVGVKVAKVAKELSEVGVGKTDQAITSNLEKSYVNILALEKTVELLNRNLENLGKIHDMTLNAVKAGVAEQNDADQISIQVASMKSAVNSTERAIEVLYNTIRLLTGVSADKEIVLTQKLEDVINPEAILALMGTELDLRRNFDYQLQVKSTELAEKQVTLSKMSYVPTLTAFYSFDKKKYLSDDDGMNMTPPNTVGLRLNVPIWSSGSRWADVRSAKMDYEKSLNTLDDTELQLGIQEKQLRYNLTSAFENFQIQSENIDVMQRVFNSNAEKFKYGTISSMQLTTSSTELVSAQNTYINALLDMVSAHVELRNLLNK